MTIKISWPDIAKCPLGDKIVPNLQSQIKNIVTEKESQVKQNVQDSVTKQSTTREEANLLQLYLSNIVSNVNDMTHIYEMSHQPHQVKSNRFANLTISYNE